MKRHSVAVSVGHSGVGSAQEPVIQFAISSVELGLLYATGCKE
jgi:hypothetical protein